MFPATECYFLLLVVAALARAHASDTDSTFSKIKDISTTITNQVAYLPPMIVLGKSDGDIIRCPYATPTLCETYHSGSSPVTATIVHGEYLFAALKSGVMLRCIWQSRQSCRVFQQADSEMTGLAVLAGNIHVALRNGAILQCQMNEPYSCRPFANIATGIASLTTSGSFLYAGLSHGRIDRCETSGNCSEFCVGPKDYDVTGLAAVGKTVFGLLSYGYIQTGNGTSSKCEIFGIDGTSYGGIAVYNSKLYAVQKDLKRLRTHVPGSRTTTLFATHNGAESISFAYGTYAMQEKYRTEPVKCIWRGVFNCPPTVFYYDNVQHRSALEVLVKDGKLYDSQGVLVDTSNADESHSQRAAIFAMGPDGQILLSNEHSRGRLHTSSLFAGNPVSGAGLMVVEQGKIVNFTSCSLHYRPDHELNDQVREALRTKGYTDSIDIQLCSYDDMLCVLDGTSGKYKWQMSEN